ncbi:MAG: coiled-coil domain-containing protein [Rhabdochlamydiaceae bacterium]
MSFCNEIISNVFRGFHLPPVGPNVIIRPSDGGSLEEIVSYSQTHQIFDSIKQNASSLPSLSNSRVLEVCKQISQGIQTLVVYTDRAIQELTIKENGLSNKLINAERQHTDVYQTLQKNKTYLNDLESQLLGLYQQEKDLNECIKKLNNELWQLEKNIEKANIRRIDGLTDLIPFVGFVGGLVTGRFERMIPFYSQVRGIISWVQQEKEYYQNKLDAKYKERRGLNEEVDSDSAKINQQKSITDLIETETKRLASEKDRLDKEIKQLGIGLTYFKNVNSFLKKIQGKYEFLSMDVNMIEEFIDIDLLKADLVLNFLHDLENTKQSFLLLPSQSGLNPEQKIYDQLYKLCLCLNTSDNNNFSVHFKTLASGELSQDSQNSIDYYIYLACKEKYDTSDPEFGKHAIDNPTIPSALIQHAILEYVFQSLSTLNLQQKTLYDQLYKLYIRLNIQDGPSTRFETLTSQGLSQDNKNNFYYYIYLICKEKYDTSDSEFGKHAIDNPTVPNALIQHAILDYAFQSTISAKGSALFTVA